jgi:signal transduction histidine kinase
MSQVATRPLPWTPAEQVRLTLFRILAVLRIVVLVYALAVNLGRVDELARPGLAGGALVAMVVWTGLADTFYQLRRHRPVWFFVTDVAVAIGFMLLTLATHSAAMRDAGESSLPTLWVAGSVLAVAVGLGWWQGLLAAVFVSVVDVAIQVQTTANTWANIFLLLMAGAAVGFMSTTLCRSAEARAAAEHLQAALEERARLSRVVHDGVLQLLAMLQRQAREGDIPAADLAELARMAAEQELSLRSLIQYDARAASQAAAVTTSGVEVETELVHALEQVVGGHSLSVPGGPVTLPSAVVTEVVAAVSECLANVVRHVGQDARAWVLVEALDDEVVVTVRDEGPGIAADRLAEAAAQGRMGVSGSILGRLRDLGGHAELTTGPTIGTEWELHVPRTATAQEGRTP